MPQKSKIRDLEDTLFAKDLFPGSSHCVPSHGYEGEATLWGPLSVEVVFYCVI